MNEPWTVAVDVGGEEILITTFISLSQAEMFVRVMNDISAQNSRYAAWHAHNPVRAINPIELLKQAQDQARAAQVAKARRERKEERNGS